MTKVIVSGAAGFIGSNFVHLALEQNWFDEIVVIDKLTYAANKDYIPDSPKIKSYFVDIADTPVEELQDADYYINFAAETHVDRAIASSIVFTENNVLSLHKLIETIRLNEIDMRFLHISTDEVYGSILEGSFSENDKLFPRNPYSASKAAAELLINSYMITYNMDFIITRSSNNYGPRQNTEKLLPKMIEKFLKGESIGIYGEGKQIRDWTNVFDNCRGIYTALTSGKTGEVYNISANDERENIEMAKLVSELMDINYDYMEFIEDRLGHDFRYSIATDKIRSLGWKPEIELQDGLLQTIQWYKDNQSK
ncbi:MAG: GDP-mannose 4,6-dehydratase [Candidatus Heimdallarchaeota archaeon]|nr:GDP-mannose 4,6-dehydratase [Candidatus Heimdallarchaeota archaeon]